MAFNNHKALHYRYNNVEIFTDLCYSLNIQNKYNCDHSSNGAYPVCLRTHREIYSYVVKERRINNEQSMG
jgi:hypothetical protein